MEKMIRSFGRSELAQQYFPRLSAMSAWRKFREWLDFNPRLRSLLSLTRRTYTPAEVQLIYAELGEPWIKWLLIWFIPNGRFLPEALVKRREPLFCLRQKQQARGRLS